MHDNDTPFQRKYIECNNVVVTALYTTNCISKLFLEYFIDLKVVKSLTIAK